MTPGALLPGERVLWQGGPSAACFARDVLHLRLVALYLGGLLIWNAWADRRDGLSPVETLRAGVPLAVLGLVVLAAGWAFAVGIARSTRYTITSERCLIRFGLALRATVSLPLRQVGTVAVRARADGSGDIPLALKAAAPSFFKLWPHTRPWRLRRPQPMLRAVPDATRVAAVLGEAALAAQQGRRPGGFAPWTPTGASGPRPATPKCAPTIVGAHLGVAGLGPLAPAGSRGGAPGLTS